jgi:methyl-accepting chemotaxis protein
MPSAYTSTSFLTQAREAHMLFGKRSKRKIYFIKKDFQSRFILRFVAVSTVWLAASVLLFFYLAHKKLEEIRYSSHIDIRTTSELLMPVTVSALAVSLLIFACILGYAIHTLLHRLSGPLDQIRRDISRIAGGDLTSDIILRKKDEFQDLAADLEKMRTVLRERFARIKEQQAMLSVAAVELSRSVQVGNASPQQVASLESVVAGMKEAVHVFQS